MPHLRTVTATRYVTPLREGGSLPAVVEADDDGMYVVKFRGAGQGVKSLIAELVTGEIGRLLGLPVPELVFIEIDPQLAKAEPDFEIQELLARSAGLNIALDFLPGAMAWTPAAVLLVDPALAAKIVWFDALCTNVDRTPRNPNLVVWHRAVWCIDHGASLLVHHTWTDPAKRARAPFAGVKDHVLLGRAGSLLDADAQLRPLLTPERIAEVLAMIPAAWLEPATPFDDSDALRQAYADYLNARIAQFGPVAEEAERVRATGV